jgi:hypothetical protein
LKVAGVTGYAHAGVEPCARTATTTPNAHTIVTITPIVLLINPPAKGAPVEHPLDGEEE